MIICLCGDETDKKVIIEELLNIYKDKLVICDLYKLRFNTRIETENIKYKLNSLPNSLESKNRLYRKYVDKVVRAKIDDILKSNKDKIILLTSNNILSEDINKLSYFKICDLKILITSQEKYNNNSSIFSHKKLYNKNKFDYVLDTNEKIDIKRLVKL